MLLMPPLYLVCFQNIQQRVGSEILVVTITLSLALGVADHRLADSYREGDWSDWTRRRCAVPSLKRRSLGTRYRQSQSLTVSRWRLPENLVEAFEHASEFLF